MDFIAPLYRDRVCTGGGEGCDRGGAHGKGSANTTSTCPRWRVV